MNVTWFLLVVAAYLLGAVPFGLILARLRGVDIRREGSGNIGATNVGRVLGRGWGRLCLVLDAAKGLAPALLARFLLAREPLDATAALQWTSVAAAAVLGHTFPVYLGFRGGKGVATTVGVALGVFPYYTAAIVAALAAYALVRYGSGYVSAGSLTIAIVFPLAVAIDLMARGRAWSAHWPLVALAVLLGALIIVRHTGNVKRLLSGQEHRAA